MQTKEYSITDKKYLVPFILITSLFFLWGFARAILDVLNKHFQNALHISITHSALIQVTTYLGYFLMAIPAGFFINRYGYRRGVVFGLLLFGLGSLLFIPGAAAGSFYAFLGCLFIIGCGLVFLETAANPYVTELGAKETATSRLNLSQSFNGLGGIFATLCIGQFLFRSSGDSGNVVIPYTILGILVLLIALVFSRVDLPEIQHVETQEDAEEGSKIGKLFAHHKMFVFGLIALLSYEVAEISINSYFINFVTGMHWMDDRTASVELTCALAFFMVGRFLGAWIMRKVSAIVMHLCRGLCVLHLACADVPGSGVHDSPPVQLYVRGHYVPYHLLHCPHGLGQSHQDSLFALDDDAYRRMRILADGHDSRPHACGDAIRGAFGGISHRFGLCTA